MLALLALLGIPAAARSAASPIAWNGQPGYGYLVNPTDQLGVPGAAAGAGILPDGSIFTPSVEVTPWMGGSVMGVSARRGLPDPVVPLYATAPDVDGADAAWWATEIANIPVAVLALSPGTRRQAGIALRWGGTKKPGGKPAAYRFARPAKPARPGLYTQPGKRFRKGQCWKVVKRGRAWVVERGRTVVAIIVGPAERSDRRLPLVSAPRDCPTSPNLTAISLRYRLASAGDQLRVVVPMEPMSRTDGRIRDIRHADLTAGAQQMAERWRADRAAGAVIKLPEVAVQRALDASITGMLVPRHKLPDGRWVQNVNMLQYHAFWIRDVAVIADALDRVGLSTPAEQDLDFLTDWQTPEGTFVSRVGQGDGFGQALWGLGQHVRLTGDAAFARRWAPAVDRAVTWATNTIATTPTGLLPPSDPKDNEWAKGTLTGDQLWGVAGLDAAASLAGYAGDTAQRARAIKARDTLRARVVTAMRATAVAGRIQPTLDGTVGTSWGDRWAAWPYPTLAPTDPLVQSSLQAAIAEQQEGVAMYAGRYLHSYLGFRDWQTLLRAGEQTQPVAGLYATIAHLTATGGGFETSVAPWSTRDAKVNLAPHAWLSAELTTFVHDLIAHDEGSDLMVLSALPSAWTQPGAVTEVQRLPTGFGPLDLRLTPNATGATLTWNLELRAGQKAPRIRWPLPPWVQLVRATGTARAGNELRMSATSGTVEVTWTRQGDQGPTYAGTLAALQGGYLVRGLTPPN